MIKYYQVGKYEQMVKLADKDIIGMSCTCMYMSLHPDAWETGNKLCWHLIKVLRLLRGKE